MIHGEGLTDRTLKREEGGGMKLTVVQNPIIAAMTKEDKNRLRVKKWTLANPEKVKAYKAEYYQKNKDKARIQAAKWRHRNLEKYNAKKRAWEANNRDKVKAYREEWAKNNPEKVKEMRAAFYRKNIEKRKEYAAKWREENRDRFKAMIAAWQEKNWDRVIIAAQNHRALKKKNGGKLSPDLAEKLLGLQKWKCSICKTSLKESGYHLDHIVPLSLGGRNDDCNIQITCPKCNHKKNKKDPIIFMREMGYLL